MTKEEMVEFAKERLKAGEAFLPRAAKEREGLEAMRDSGLFESVDGQIERIDKLVIQTKLDIDFLHSFLELVFYPEKAK